MNGKNSYHTSVLLQEVVTFLGVREGGRYIDGTFGGGGHAAEIFRRGGIVLGIDMDQDALRYGKENFKSQISVGKLRLVKGNFREIDKLAGANGFANVDGILLDLGVSSFQLDTPGRGFSFQSPGPLDMRMDRELGVTAKDLLTVLSKGELYELFTTFGEERLARPIADSIVKSRRVKQIETTEELGQIVSRVVSGGHPDIHPATRVFQALRIAVNDELENLRIALPKAVQLLKENGRLCVISFHSLEDRIVKTGFLEMEKQVLGQVVTKKPVVADEDETNRNRRARSAKLRVFERK